MAIYLVQHGKSYSKEEDPEQGLSVEGKTEVELIAGVAENYQITVSNIVHSGKKRARETAEIFAQNLCPQGEVTEKTGLKALDDVNQLALKVRSDNHTMYVGHLPFMEKLVCRLVTGRVDYRIFNFQNGGIVCLDQDKENEFWYIKWTLMPHIGN